MGIVALPQSQCGQPLGGKGGRHHPYMSEQDKSLTALGLTRNSWLMYRALFRNDVLYADAQAIIAGTADAQEAASALVSWIEEHEDTLAPELGLLAVVLPPVLTPEEWIEVVEGFTPDDPRLVEDLMAREAYGLPPVIRSPQES